jgi:hypothetical protein
MMLFKESLISSAQRSIISRIWGWKHLFPRSSSYYDFPRLKLHCRGSRVTPITWQTDSRRIPSKFGYPGATDREQYKNEGIHLHRCATGSLQGCGLYRKAWHRVLVLYCTVQYGTERCYDATQSSNLQAPSSGIRTSDL